MRQVILLLATVASLFGGLFLIALSLGLIIKGMGGYGIVILLLGVPIMGGLLVTFDYVRNKLALSEDPDLDVDIIKPKFTKFGGGG